jgi:hypothetical protein
MKKFEIVKTSGEIREKSQIRPGCTTDDSCPEIIASFDEKDKAIAALEAYKTTIQELSSHGIRYYLVEEYHVEESEYNENNEWIGGGDVWAFSEIASI